MRGKKTVKKNVFIILIFFILSCIFMFSFIEINRFNVISDSSFHLTRANEIYQNLKQGSLFTFIATHTFNHTGVANFLFYPTVFLYPLALLRFIFNPITSIYIWIGMFLFFTLVIAFYSMLSFSKSYLRSFIFSLIYTLAPYHLYLGLWNGVYGEYIAYTFIPLVFLGIYHILWEDESKWIILSCGMVLLCYSHILSVYISLLLCIILLVIKLLTQKVSAIRILNLIKSIFITILLAGWEFIPFLTDYVGRDIKSPQKQFYFLHSFDDLVNGSLQNTCGGGIACGQTLGIVLVVTLFIGIVFVKNSSKELSCYIIGVILAIVSTTFVDWTALSRNAVALNFLGIIQFPYRLLLYANLFLAITASYIVSRLIQNLTQSKYKKALIILGITFIEVIGYFSTIQPALNQITAKNLNYLSKMQPTQPIPSSIIDKANYSNLFTGSTNTGEKDYFPENAYKNAVSILEGKVISSRTISDYQRKDFPNMEEYCLKVNKNTTINLPIIAYHRTVVKLNNRLNGYKISKRGTVEIKLKKGENIVKVEYRPSRLYYIMLIISVITAVGLFIKKLN